MRPAACHCHHSEVTGSEASSGEASSEADTDMPIVGWQLATAGSSRYSRGLPEPNVSHYNIPTVRLQV